MAATPEERLVAEYLPAVKKAARVMLKSGRVPVFVRMDDLVQDGILGLLQAARRFDESKGFQFWTFAEPRVRGAMIDGMRREWPLVPFGGLAAWTVVSGQGEGPGLAVLVAGLAEEGPEERRHRREQAVVLQKAISGLRKRDQQIVRLHYFRQQTMQAVGQKFGVNQSRISQILKRCRAELRQAAGLREFRGERDANSEQQNTNL